MSAPQGCSAVNEPMFAESGAAVVRVGALRKFKDLVRSMGSDPEALLLSAQIDPNVLENRHAVIAYRTMVHLLERAAAELSCPDFGMRLAAVQGGGKVCGPLDFAMKNSATVGEAFEYCAEHMQVYSPATQITIEQDNRADRVLLRFEILLSRLANQRQGAEHALLLTRDTALTVSSGRVTPREVWFTHEPLAPAAVYRRYFQTIVRFGQPANGLVFTRRDLAIAIDDPDPQLYELAASFIDTRFPAALKTLTTQVRTLVSRLLAEGVECDNDRIASALGLHPRTLQRRLRDEGERLDSIKDSVRRDIALTYLRQPKIPLTVVAEMLGYSEPSVLWRKCYQWFQVSPRELRKQLTEQAAPSSLVADAAATVPLATEWALTPQTAGSARRRQAAPGLS